MSNNKGRLTARIWFGMINCSLMGAIAWQVETVYFNTFLSDAVFDEGSFGASLTLTDAVNIMVSLSALISVITSFIMGTLSEKLRNRKTFLSAGYIFWGITTAFFGVISKENVASVLGLSDKAEIVTTTAWVVIIMDLLMTIMGATSSEAVFHSWITDVTTPETTSKTETVFTLLGFVATGIVMGIGSYVQADRLSYSTFFIGIGVLVTLAGITNIFLIDNPEKFQTKIENQPKTSFWADLFYGFRPSVIKENKNLYFMLLSGCAFNSAFQVFYPYLFIYFEKVIEPANKDVNLDLLGIVTVCAMVFTVSIEGILILMKLEKKKKAYSFIISVICYVVGLLMLSATKNVYLMLVGVGPVLTAYVTIMIQFGATVRDNIPQDRVGLFQGVRMLFLSLIPMVVGPTLGNIAAKNSTITYMDDGAEKVLPTEMMFVYAAIIGALIFIPMLIFLKLDSKKRLEENNE